MSHYSEKFCSLIVLLYYWNQFAAQLSSKVYWKKRNNINVKSNIAESKDNSEHSFLSVSSSFCIIKSLFFNQNIIRCEEFLRSREHIDLDVAPAQLWEHQWEQFLTEYYSIAQGGAKIQVIQVLRCFYFMILEDHSRDSFFNNLSKG